MVVSSQVSKKPPPSIQLAQLWSWIKIPNISFNSFQLTPTHPPLLISSSVRVSKIEIVQMFIHTYFFFRLYSLTLIVSRLNYYLKGVLSVNASPFPVHVGDKIYLRYLVLDKLRYSQWPSNVIHGSSDIEKYISKAIVLRIWSFHFVHHFPFVPRAKSDRKLSFVARYFITFIFPRKLIFFILLLQRLGKIFDKMFPKYVF